MESNARQALTDRPEEPTLGSQVRSTVGRLYRRFRRERPDGTLGDKALEVLTWLHKSGPQTLTELSARDGVTPASMSETVNRLTAAGYAVRSPDPSDRRRVRFSTTREGAELARTAREQRNAWLGARLRTLTPDQRATLAQACRILDQLLDS